jgi:hypothetical protein
MPVINGRSVGRMIWMGLLLLPLLPSSPLPASSAIAPKSAHGPQQPNIVLKCEFEIARDGQQVLLKQLGEGGGAGGLRTQQSGKEQAAQGEHGKRGDLGYREGKDEKHGACGHAWSDFN